ncbi:hypothetical protein BJ123_102178 [Rhodopseudomonas thermotolerans]|uniref:Uncharacterized protein n=2 Tax=Rhodopseudomonas TaxID=1073 RepID=A0A336JI60_9BRAD|nr:MULTISPECIES: hypothetical protein [Rhodopseudomonas]RED42007.1 hypothetical protein BJ125_102176 [Rhodopseudomonas pentothenatexigens]REG07468.1 hypothetical protein BJ123_102178 [Rhodopseudomonas thermotolerans]SSW89367.1 hypothetical protein SAMN05892882_102176 [Rhodopseudomonas pentothenatexigens]
MSDFELQVDWVDQEGRNQSDATLASLLIQVGGVAVTEFTARHMNKFGGPLRNKCKAVQIPAYFVAEWIADNWWSILWEPRKNEEEADDDEFLSRHSLLTAQHGFSLPRLEFVASGGTLQISARARDPKFSDVRFCNSARATAPREKVESELRRFVQSVVDRLNDRRVSETWLQDTWSLITETKDDELSFCRFIGALGMSPYDIDDGFAKLIERLEVALGERLLMDLCLASSESDFASVSKVAEEAVALTRTVEKSTLSPIEAISVPQDNYAVPAFRRGLQAAEILRKRLGISDTDPNAASRIFDMLEIDTTLQTKSVQRNDDVAVTGAVVRFENEMKVALLQQTEAKRRFAAARAVFSAWSSETPTESRLLTSAVTRDQQANRAFAAELTAPKALIRSRFRGKKRKFTQSDIRELADELRVSPDVVRKQASNNGVTISFG